MPVWVVFFSEKYFFQWKGTSNFIWSSNPDAHCKEYHPFDYSIVTKDNIDLFLRNDDEIKKMEII